MNAFTIKVLNGLDAVGTLTTRMYVGDANDGSGRHNMGP